MSAMNERRADEWTERNLGQTYRRLLILTFYLCMIVFSGVIVFKLNNWWVLPAIGLLVLALVIHFRLIRPIAREVMKGNVLRLDERQLGVRDRAHYHAYQILGGLFVTLFAYAVWATMFDGAYLPMPSTNQHFGGLLFFFCQLVTSLPASVVAWIEPDPISDGD